MNDPRSEPARHGFDEPRNVTRLYRGLVAACGLLLVIELFVNRHAVFGLEGWFGFFAVYGLLACFIVVGGGVVLRKFVIRPEDYYER